MDTEGEMRAVSSHADNVLALLGSRVCGFLQPIDVAAMRLAYWRNVAPTVWREVRLHRKPGDLGAEDALLAVWRLP